MAEINRRWIYLLVLLSLSLPLLLKVTIKPARLVAAEKYFALIENLPKTEDGFVLVVMDYGPNSKAENMPQTEVLIEHLLRRRVRFATFAQYPLAEPFLGSLPQKIIEKLEKELPSEKWVYGRDWINLGYRPGYALIVKNMAESPDWGELLRKDARGTPLSELEMFSTTRSIKNVIAVAQFTSLIGTIDSFLQFFRNKEYTPPLIHGCTSITIPQAFIYLDSGQLSGLLEGVAGAAWYSFLLEQTFPGRAPDTARLMNTGLGFAHLLIIALVIVGNISMFLGAKSKRRAP